jgi:nitroreductase
MTGWERIDFMPEEKLRIAARTVVSLPRPRFVRGKSLSESLRLRCTTREISSRKLPPQALSNLLWAACGINRRKGPFGVPGVTAASASNSQEIDVYVATDEGVWLFDAAKHRLLPVSGSDVRNLSISPGQGRFVTMSAPIQLIYVVDLHRLTHTAGFEEPGLHDPEVQKSYYYVDTGLIAGNVYLFAASQGLAAWFHNCDRSALAKRLRLRAEQRVLFAQSVGYPERKRSSGTDFLSMARALQANGFR